LGRSVIVNHGAVVDHDVVIGEFSHVAPRAALGGNVVVGKRVLIGAGASVLPGIRIADDVTVGAGAVVIEHLDQPGVYAGVPARRLK
ncbi:MAG: acetyltransferase, partial [Ramlibacter sp.]|nr:acetyltransferase [Ramlibacter sp.]